MNGIKKTVAAAMIFAAVFAQIPVTSSAEDNADGTTYYVATNGNDRNSGLSTEKPFRTIQKAADAAEAGDTVFVRGGVYTESIYLENSGNEGAPIIFRNYAEEAPVIDGTTLKAEAGIALEDCSYIIIDGLTVCGFRSADETAVMGILIEGSGVGVEIRNCKVHDIRTVYSSGEMDRNAHGIAVYGTNSDPDAPISDIVIDGNEVFSCSLGQSEAVVLNGNVDGFTVTNNKIHDNDNIGIDFIGYEGTANAEREGARNASQDRARNGVCSGNRVWNITCAKNPTYEGAGLCADGIYVDGGCDILIENNVINGCDIGIEAASEHYACSADRITIRNNLIKNCRGSGGISIGGSDPRENGTAKNLTILNNTLYLCEPSLAVQNTNSSTNQIGNNIFYSPGATAIEGEKGNNCFFNNRTADPLFFDPVSGDFRLQAASGAIDAGLFLEECGMVDLAGKNRMSGKSVDCGAYEYQKK